MGWSQLGTQFCLEIAFGVLFALAFVPKAPVGAFFYRIMGTAALVLLLLALAMPLSTGAGEVRDPGLFATGLAAAAYPFYSGPLRGKAFGLGLAAGALGAALAVFFGLRAMLSDAAPARLALSSFSALATGAVAGSVGLAMVLGHWYLTVPNLDVRHLARLNRVAAASMLASLSALAALCLLEREPLAAHPEPLFGATGLFYLGTRVAVGLLLPLAFAAMTAGSLKYKNTRSATGILYASTVLVLIGSAVALSLQETYGIPL